MVLLGEQQRLFFQAWTPLICCCRHTIAGGGPEAAAAQEDPWARTSGGRRLAQRVGGLQRPTLFRRLAFVPPGYTSLMFAHLNEDSSCRAPTRLFSGFRRFVLAPYGLGAGNAARGGNPTVRVRLVSRRPGPGRPRVARQIANEEEILAMLRALGGGNNTAPAEQRSDDFAAAAAATGNRRLLAEEGLPVGLPPVDAQLVDLAALPLREQLALVADVDVLVGMHGAALAYGALMQPGAALVELWPKAEGVWRCYEHLARWAGVEYRYGGGQRGHTQWQMSALHALHATSWP